MVGLKIKSPSGPDMESHGISRKEPLKTRALKLHKGYNDAPACTSRAGGASSFAQRERARVESSPMLVISQHRSRKGAPP